MKVCYLCKRKYERNARRSYYPFPKDRFLRKDWFHCLGLTTTQETYTHRNIFLCSDHFAADDINEKNGKRYLRKGALPLDVTELEHDQDEISQFTFVECGKSLSIQQLSSSSSSATESISEPICLPLPSSSTSLTKTNTEVIYLQVSSSSSSATESASEIEDYSEIASFDNFVSSGNPPEIVGPSQNGVKKIQRFLEPRYVGDCSTDEMGQTEKKRWELVQRSMAKLKKKLRASQQRERRLKNRLEKLKALLQQERNKNRLKS